MPCLLLLARAVCVVVWVPSDACNYSLQLGLVLRVNIDELDTDRYEQRVKFLDVVLLLGREYVVRICHK